ncbi:B12-binding domain-containing radical SAM protein [Clostridium botulinum C]|uniref:B12-binding domain-containing radical SAM protein n=3 Tax=Clostridium botulinum TaxID=1491 RepID=A0A9Q4TJD9_CLOBO|nr:MULTISPECIES: radical SAM protein [Clostridium]EGO87039.1 methyltransferase [Clostridium botulinum C str. Stockholm]EES90468.1 oxygen-independent coproporphyrinogen III oxidase, Fe-S oxidoreductase [Clostridium botulinum D str. 1873]MBO3442454.1 B12-binding domain-containing radical SAM protein [Clostridium haemolyticum]MCD3195651.1 B12-binding domain-containing radical SAM protein [Clostridium botulinum C]MCD3201066.1 B12-binding domain-containing radical SAM protein [Clostridium botulinum
MRYEGTVYRPPSEAYSLIIQVTLGCSHNKCTFCNMYKDRNFKIKSLDEVFEDLELSRKYYKYVRRIFLADGDALILKTENLEKILMKIKELFPECERVSVYGTPADILRKSEEDLIKLKKLGLDIIYIGVESGSDEVLKDVNKGVTSEEIIKAGQKVKRTGIKLSATLISGLGGKEKSKLHAKESARVISAINPDYLGILTLMIEPGTQIYNKVENNEMTLLNPKEVMVETRELIRNLEVSNCIFRSNHASNYAPLAATLGEEKERLLKELDSIIGSDYSFKDEYFRRF